MRTYKSPEPAAAAVAQVSQSSQQSSTQLSIFPFLKLATLSFAIPPPISASVRSRQAGTETEREASAMEALGPGKTFKKRIEEPLAAGSEPCVGRVCANASLHWGPRLQRRPPTSWRENKPRPSPCVCVYACVWVYLHRAGTHVFRLSADGWGFNRVSRHVCAVLFIGSTHKPVVSGLALCEWGFN